MQKNTYTKCIICFHLVLKISKPHDKSWLFHNMGSLVPIILVTAQQLKG